MNEQSTTDRYTLADLEKWSEVTRDVDPPIHLGVLGDPVAHSLSPQMQNAALRAFEIKMQYARFHIRADELRSAVRFLGARDDIPELLGQSDVFVLEAHLLQDAVFALLAAAGEHINRVLDVHGVFGRGGRVGYLNVDVLDPAELAS